jgi:hypothetical protein
VAVPVFAASLSGVGMRAAAARRTFCVASGVLRAGVGQDFDGGVAAEFGIRGAINGARPSPGLRQRAARALKGRRRSVHARETERSRNAMDLRRAELLVTAVIRAVQVNAREL